MSFVAFAFLSAVLSLVALIWCLLQRRVWIGLLAAAILAAVTVLHLYAAAECSAAV